MTARNVVLGLDIGTTSIKGVLFDSFGKQVLDEEELIQTFHPKTGWAEQDPIEIEKKARFVLKNVMNHVVEKELNLLGVGFSTAMHSLICIDDSMQPISNMIIWSDGRSTEQAERLSKEKGKGIFLKTGTPIHPMSPFVKLVWMKETNYGPYTKAAYFMSMKEYLIWKWFGQRVIDYGMASATGLYNLEEQSWDQEAMHIAGVSEAQLSEIVAPDLVLPPISKEVANDMGLKENTPFVIGSADGQLANLGDGAILPGEVAISVGTSGAIRQFTSTMSVDHNFETFTYAFTKDTGIVGGPTNNGGIVVQWLKDILQFEGSFEELMEGATHISPGSDGIIFIPYVNGERAPVWNQQAKGSFCGLTIEHQRDHLVRAVLEGIAFNLYQIGQSLEKIAGKPASICVNGGLSKSELWVQILADVFGHDMQIAETHHSSAWGAAWTALVGVKEAKSFEGIKEHISGRKTVAFNQERHKVYQHVYSKYVRLSQDLLEYA